MRKILFLIPTLTGGGAERVIVTLLTHLDRSRFKPMLAVVDLRGAAFRADIPADVELVDLQATRVLYALPSIVRLIWQRRPDVVLSTLGHLNLALSIVRPLFPRGIRTIARESCVVSETLASSRFPRLWSFLYRHFYRKHDLVVCQSQDMHDDLTRTFGFPAHRSVIIHNPVDMEKIRNSSRAPIDHPAFAAGGPVLVAAGRLEHQKGFDLLIEADGAAAGRARPSGDSGRRPAGRRTARERAKTRPGGTRALRRIPEEPIRLDSPKRMHLCCRRATKVFQTLCWKRSRAARP